MRVLVYDATDGDLLHSLKNHKEAVYAVSYSRDGQRFASGGADSTIVIWSNKAEGLLKYSHADPIQSLEYNPVTHQLASATASDFGLWSPEKKHVAKHKVASKVCCMAWSPDGQTLALGLFGGQVSMRDRQGAELAVINRSEPVWSLSYNPVPGVAAGGTDSLAVGCWDGTLSFYTYDETASQMQQIGKDRPLGFDPTTVSHYSGGDYILVGGTDNKTMLATKEGVMLCPVSEGDDWVWCSAGRPKHNYVAVGRNDGTIAMNQLVFNTVHGLYQDRYAWRDCMTDVIVTHLISEQKVRIRCRDYIKKIAVYKDRLAVQLPSRVIIYELTNADPYDMHYRVKEKIQKALDCNLLVVTTNHVILCQEKKLQLYSFAGEKEREWVMEAVIRYIKVVGGAPGREGLLVGLKNGGVLRIFVDKAFPQLLVTHTAAVRCLDMSANRLQLAVVDENAKVYVYDVATQKVTYEAEGANSVAWNADFEDMFCYSGNGVLSTKTGDCPVHQQKLQGFVVGFAGSKIFCLHYVSMQTIDVPQTASMLRYIEDKDFRKAYEVACLGVTEADWRTLATEAMANMHLDIARRAFIRVRDVHFIGLLNRIEGARKASGGLGDGGTADDAMMAEIFAYQGKYQEAAKRYGRIGMTDRAMQMFSDLRQFDEAKRWADSVGTSGGGAHVQELMQRQAEWSEEVNDNVQAAEMYIKLGKFDKAIALLGRGTNVEKLAELARTMDSSHPTALRACAQYLQKAGAVKHAREAYERLGDTAALVKLAVSEQEWDSAFRLLRSAPQLREEVYLPFAQHLVSQDRFDEAREAYAKAGRPDMGALMLEQLTHNAVSERRFADAGVYYWQLAMDELTRLHGVEGSGARSLRKYQALLHRAEIYHAYDIVYSNTDTAFTTAFQPTIFNAARLLLGRLTRAEAPSGVSLVYVLHALATHGEAMGAYKLARHAYNRLQALRVPPTWQEQVDIACIAINSRPFSDDETLLPVCYRCGTVNPILNGDHENCVNCGCEMVVSYLTFELLPLVRFELEPGISHEEAQQLLAIEPSSGGWAAGGGERAGGYGGRRENRTDVGESLRLDDDDDDIAAALGSGATAWDEQASIPGAPITATRGMLRDLRDTEVKVRKLPGLPPAYYRLMDPDVSIACSPAGKFFELDEYELAVLEADGKAPFCRTPLAADGSPMDTEARDLGDAAAAAKGPKLGDLSASAKWNALSIANSIL